MTIRKLFVDVKLNLRGLIDAVRDVLVAVTEFEVSTMSPRSPASEVTRAPVPDGWPPCYGRKRLEDGPYAGRYVITVKDAVTGRVAATSLPAWHDEEDARVDAWERHEYDPAPELVNGA